MPYYIVDRRADAHGDHVVHVRESVWGCLPVEARRRELGSHEGCASAMRIAVLFYGSANGCERCAVTCHARRTPAEPALPAAVGASVTGTASA